MLTRKQHQLLMFLKNRLEETGVSPSFEEMKSALGLKSKSGIHRLISALEERGFIHRMPHRARALEVIRMPDAALPAQRATDESSGFRPNVIRGDFANALQGARVAEVANQTIFLPLYGKIAAGTPIEALRDETAQIDVPPSLLGRGEHYVLEVDGDSMIGAGILPGDRVVIERCDNAENGAVVVALIDHNEVTLKRLRRKGDTVALEPANPSYETRIFGADRVNIQGKLVGLLRRY